MYAMAVNWLNIACLPIFFICDNFHRWTIFSPHTNSQAIFFYQKVFSLCFHRGFFTFFTTKTKLLNKGLDTEYILYLPQNLRLTEKKYANKYLF